MSYSKAQRLIKGFFCVLTNGKLQVLLIELFFYSLDKGKIYWKKEKRMP